MAVIIYNKYPYSSFYWKKLCYIIKNENAIISEQTDNGEKVPKLIRDVIQKSLNKNPSDRFKSAIEINEVFKEFKNEQTNIL